MPETGALHQPRRRTCSPARLTSAWCLVPIAAVALILRFAGIDWGGNYYTHPDELFMTMVATEIHAPGTFSGYLETATSPLNPYNGRFDSFVYGTFPLFAAKLLGSITGHDVFGNGHLPGRWLAAIADTGSVLLVYWIGRRMFGQLAGALGSLLLAFTMLDIQAAHYFTTDAMAAFFATSTFALVLQAGHRRGFGWYALAGLAAGLAAASKPNLLIAFGLLALPLLETIRMGGWRSAVPNLVDLFGRDDRRKPFPVLFATALAGFIAIWTFRFAQPYAFADSTPFSFRLNPQWTGDLSFWQRAQAGSIDLPPSIQWAERTPVLFILDNLVRWGMGPGMGLAALAGLALLIVRIVIARKWPSWWVLGIAGWVLFHIFFFGTSLGKAQRYLLPAYPMLAVLAGLTLVRLIDWARGRGALRPPGQLLTIRFPRWCHPGYLVPALVVLSTMLYGIAFTTIFTREHTRVVASEWIFENVPAGSTIATEYWDFGLPLQLPGMDVRQYQSFPLDLYRTDSPAKLSKLIGQLERTDYIVISSNRLFESIPRMPWRYPMTTAYYGALFSGELGFEQVGHFTSFPELLGVELDDRNAEESLTVYDHPEVYIFRKSATWSDNAAWYLLDDALGQGGLPLLPADTQPDAMMLNETEQATLSRSGTWSGIFDPGGLTNDVPALFWYLAVQILTVPAIPLLWLALPHLPDRGYALAKTIGVAAVGWIAWLLTTTPLTGFGTRAIVIAWIAMLGMSCGAVRSCSSQFFFDLRGRRSWIVATELLFGGVFAAAALIRVLTPDIWTTSPGRSALLDFGVFNATIRTPEFPPYDPWLADGTVHDVYLGYVPWAVVTRLTGIVPETAYSLTIATLFALLCLNAWVAGAVLIARFRPDPGTANPDLSARRIIGHALIAPVMLAGLGSFAFAQRIGSGAWDVPASGGPVTILKGLWMAVTFRVSLLKEAWVAPAHFIGDRTMEFPLLSFLSGDLGPTQLAMPLAVAAIAITISFALAEGHGEAITGRMFSGVGGWRSALRFAVPAGFLFGYVLTSNWLVAIPILVLIAGLTFLSTGVRSSWSDSWSMLRDTTLVTLFTALLGGAAFYPFLDGFGRFPRETEPLASSLGLDDYLVHFGILLAIVAGYLVVQLGTAVSKGSAGAWVAVGCGLGALISFSLAISIGNINLFLVIVLAFLSLAIWRQQQDIRHLVILGIVMLGLGLGIVPERVRLVTPIGEGTIQHQFWSITWILLAIVAAPALMIVIGGRSVPPRRAQWAVLRGVGFVVLAVLIATSAIYPALAISNRVTDRPGDRSISLDNDREAVDWMRLNLTGTPIILEAPGSIGSSGPAGRISAMTGYPTVIGQATAEISRRPGMEPLVQWRLDDVNEIYARPGSFALVEPLLREYGVDLIYVGPLERATYDPIGLAKFDDAVAGGHLKVVYQSDLVTIYAYLRQVSAP